MGTRRDFIRQLGLAGMGAFLPAVWDPGLVAASQEAMAALGQLSAKDAAAQEPEWEAIRKMFVRPPDLINLENGYFCPQPIPVLKNFMEHTERINSLTSFYMRKQMEQDWESIRNLMAEFTRLPAASLALTRNTTESLDLLIHGYPWQAGDEIIVSQYDYGSMLEAITQQARRSQLVVKTIELPARPESKTVLLEHFRSAITEKTRVILATHMINLNGMVLPVQRLVKMAREHGIDVFVDAAHSFAHLAPPISELDCDFLGTSLHKWLSAPLGNGLLHVNPGRIADLWPLMGDVKHAPDDIRRFEHQGTRPPAAWNAIRAAVRFHRDIGSENKAARLYYLQQQWTRRADAHPRIQVLTPLEEGQSGAIATVAVDGLSPQELADRLLNEFKIFTVAIDVGEIRGVRVTPHLANSLAEVHLLGDALEAIAG